MTIYLAVFSSRTTSTFAARCVHPSCEQRYTRHEIQMDEIFPLHVTLKKMHQIPHISSNTNLRARDISIHFSQTAYPASLSPPISFQINYRYCKSRRSCSTPSFGGDSQPEILLWQLLLRLSLLPVRHNQRKMHERQTQHSNSYAHQE